MSEVTPKFQTADQLSCAILRIHTVSSEGFLNRDARELDAFHSVYKHKGKEGEKNSAMSVLCFID